MPNCSNFGKGQPCDTTLHAIAEVEEVFHPHVGSQAVLENVGGSEGDGGNEARVAQNDLQHLVPVHAVAESGEIGVHKPDTRKRKDALEQKVLKRKKCVRRAPDAPKLKLESFLYHSISLQGANFGTTTLVVPSLLAISFKKV